MSAPREITIATPQDVPLIHALAADTWWAAYGHYLPKDQLDYMFEVIYDEEALRRQMTDEGQTFLLLYRDGQPGGFASFSLKDQAQQVYKLNKLYVLPANQGTGSGKALLQAVEEEVRARLGQFLDLNVNRHNPAQHFYARSGFMVLHEEDIPIGAFWMNDFVMRKEIRAAM